MILSLASACVCIKLSPVHSMALSDHLILWRTFLLTSCSVFRRMVLESPHDSGYVVRGFKLPLLGVQHVFTGVYLIIHSSVPLFIRDAIGVEGIWIIYSLGPPLSSWCYSPSLACKGENRQEKWMQKSHIYFHRNLSVFPDQFQPWHPNFFQRSSRIAFWIDSILNEDCTKVF